MSIYGRIAGVGLVVALVAGLVSCVEDRGSVTILRNTVPNADCIPDPGSDEFRASGRLDISENAGLAGTRRYTMFPVVQNNLISTVEQGAVVEQNIIELIEARVDLSGSYSGRFSIPMFVTLFPGDQAGMAVDVIPSQLAAQLSPGVINVKLRFLYQLGARDRETHEIEYSIEVCDGCLVTVGSACDSGDYEDVEQTGFSCNVTQDLPVLCCTGSDGLPICPAIDTSTTE